MSYTDFIFTDYRRRVAELEASDNPLARGVAYIEGNLYPLHEARIPILDQGFLHSDLTYDVPSIWNGRFFRLDDHLDRFEKSLQKLRLRSSLDRHQIRQKLVEMAAKSGIRDAYVCMIVTRGLKFIRQYSPDEIENNLYLIVQPFVWVMGEEMQKTGGSAIIARDVRRVPPGAIDPTVGSGFNVCVIKDGVLRTPRRGVLEGVTRKTVMEVAKANGIECRLEDVPVSAAYDCDELLFVTTAGGVMPITTLDGAPVGTGEVGPLGKTIWKAYWEAHYDPMLSFAINY